MQKKKKIKIKKEKKGIDSSLWLNPQLRNHSSTDNQCHYSCIKKMSKTLKNKPKC